MSASNRSESTPNKVESPHGFSFSDYWQILQRIFKHMQEDNLSLIAAGVAFYFLLAIFPLLAALVSLYGLIVDSAQLANHLNSLIGIIPSQSRYLLEEQLSNITEQSSKELGLGFVISITLTLYSASKGADALVKACNITYKEINNRGFIMSLFIRLCITVAMVSTIIVSLVLMTFLPALVAFFTKASITQSDINFLSWPLLFMVFNLSLAALYRYAPHRSDAKWKWVLPGALTATIFWIIASIGFSFYVSEYATYNETYGSVGGIVVLLMWFYISAFIVLLGAELNAAMERQTAADSTTGEAKPIGERGAFVADNLPQKK